MDLSLMLLDPIVSGPTANLEETTLRARAAKAVCGPALGFFLFVIGLLALSAPTLAHAESILNPSDTKSAKAAFKALDKDRWRQALSQAQHIQDPIAARMIYWLAHTRSGSSSSFEDIAAFLDEAPGWPEESKLRRRAEEAMSSQTPDQVVMVWNDKWGMSSTDGRARLVGALIGTGRMDEAKALIGEVWINGNFTKQRETSFYNNYKKYLTAKDHIKRIERLLWDERYWPTRRMLWKVSKDYRTLAEARLMLMRREGNVDTAIARVPKKYENDPGLLFERLRWRRRKGISTAFDILKNPDGLNGGRAEKWWVERAYLSRLALREGNTAEAYRIASHHGLTDGEEFAEAEWISGWIAYRFLNQPESALTHFQNMIETVNYPISLARGNYWAGRTAETLGRLDDATKYFEAAAQHANTFYGQLATAKVDRTRGVVFPPQPNVTKTERTEFMSDEMARAARILVELGEEERLRPFILTLLDKRDTPTWKIMTAEFANAIGRPDLAVTVAKISERSGTSLAGAGYPQLNPPKAHANAARVTLELPMVLAMIRQESAFYVNARSHANALGLMQILPSTARKVARQLNISYSKSRLTNDPKYNLTLGQSYLASLLEEFDGSYVLAIAAYNAGPSRARAWLKSFGDLRDASVDPVDWIEQIPFDETRNYVQRVLENLQVYRQQLNGDANIRVALNLDQDLRR